MARKPVPLNVDELRKLVEIGATDEELATWFGLTARTIQEKKKIEPYKSVFQSARQKLHLAIRRAQVRKALDGNPTMLIWLGKVMLGQKDQVNLSGDAENPLTFNGKLEIVHVKANHEEV